MGAWMSQRRSFYEGNSFLDGLVWWFVMARIGQGLREEQKISKELPPELLKLAKKLEDSDWLFRSGWQEDRDLFGG